MVLPYVSNGNKKMSIPTFCLPSRVTCPGSTPTCRRLCYARKAERAYPNVLPCRMKNYCLTEWGDFVDRMVYVLSKKKKLDYFRIHESGDMYSQEYLNKWFEICRRLPGTTFLVYTQSYHLDFSHKPSNLVVYYSVWPDSVNVPEKGLFAYAGMDKGVYQCPRSCDDCMHCFNAKGNVQIEIH